MSNVEDIHGFDWPKRKLTNVNALKVFLIDRATTRFSLLICEFFFKTIYLFHTRAKRVGDFFALFIVTKQLGGIATYRVCLSKHDFCLLKCENLDNNCTVIGKHRMDLHTILKTQRE